LILVATPLADIWFAQVSALAPELVKLAIIGMWLALLLPALNALQSWFQGSILQSRQTRAIPEAVIIFLITIGSILWVGVSWGQGVGLYITIIAFTVGMGTQSLWLWYRSRLVMAKVNARDS